MMTDSDYKLSIYYQNIHSINPPHKFSEIVSITSTPSPPSLLCFTETWLKPNTSPPCLNNYKFLNFPHSSGYSGILLYFRDFINVSYISEFSKICPSKTMLICFRVHSPSPFLLFVYYFHNRSSIDSISKLLHDFILSACSHFELPCLVIGDSNANDPLFSLPHSIPNSRGAIISDFCSSSGFTVLNSIHCPYSPTHLDNSIIDLALTNDPSFFCSLSLPVPVISSDHNPLLVSCSTSPLPPKPTSPWKLNQPTHVWESYCSTLSSFLSFPSPLDRIDSFSSPSLLIDHLWFHIKKSIFSSANLHLLHPRISPSSKSKFPPHLRRLLTDYRISHNRYNSARLSNHPDLLSLKSHWKSLRILLKQQILSFSDDINNRTLESLHKNPKRLFQSFSSFTSSSPSSSISSQTFLDTFSHIFRSDPNSTSPLLISLRNYFLLEHPPPHHPPLLSVDVFVRLLSSFSSSSAIGPDNLPPLLISNGPRLLHQYLTVFINFSIIFSYLPSDWRAARSVPIHKGRGLDKTDPNNYRLISITSICSRICERVIYDKLFDHLTSIKYLSSSQAGFRPSFNTSDLFFQLLTHINSALSRRMTLPCIFFDISKAFDSVPHDLLINRLIAIHTPPYIISWICAFLQDRTFFISTPNGNSPHSSISRGVPQGCVLSPLLFIIFINPIISFIESSLLVRVLLFADDICIFPLTPNVNPLSFLHLLESASSLLFSWCSRNGLTVSIDKSCVVVFGNKRSMPSSLNIRPFPSSSSFIPSSNSFNYLGIRLSHNLCFTSHFNHLRKALLISSSQIISFIKSFSSPPPFSLLTSLVIQVMIPKIIYGFEFVPLNSRQLDVLSHMLAWPFRVHLRLPYSVASLTILAELGIPSPKALQIALLIRFIHRVSSLPPDHPSFILLSSLKSLNTHSRLFPSSGAKKYSSILTTYNSLTRNLSCDLSAFPSLFKLARHISLLLILSQRNLDSSSIHYVDKFRSFTYQQPSHARSTYFPLTFHKSRLRLRNSHFDPFYNIHCTCSSRPHLTLSHIFSCPIFSSTIASCNSSLSHHNLSELSESNLFINSLSLKQQIIHDKCVEPLYKLLAFICSHCRPP